jgi:hypothetical protein
MLNFQVENSGGTTGTFTPEDIHSQLATMGEVPKAISPDGQFITLVDGQGEFQAKTEDILRDMGWKINAIEPNDVLEDFVKPELRVAVANLGSNDEVKKAYLREKLQDMGLQNPNIVGQGTDFYVFHPESNKYFALTNKRGVDMSDIASGLSQAPGFIGGAWGGMAGAGAGAGVASIPLAVAGGAAGQFAGDALARGAIAAYDPTFRKIAGENLGEQVKDLGINALTSGGTAGAFRTLPVAARALRGANSQAPELVRGVLENGPVSSIARGIGRGAEEVGIVGSTLSKPFVGAGMARDIAASQIPGVGTMQGVGLAMQAPGGLARWITKMYGKFGGKTGERFAKDIPTNAAGDPSISRIFEKAGQTYGSKSRLGSDGIKAYRDYRKMGMEAEEALNAVRMDRGTAMGETGKKIGRVIERASNYGQKLDEAASELTGGMAKGVYGLSRATQAGGTALNRTARLASPLENRLYSKIGSEEYVRPTLDQSFDEYLRKRKNPVQSNQSIPELASYGY